MYGARLERRGRFICTSKSASRAAAPRFNARISRHRSCPVAAVLKERPAADSEGPQQAARFERARKAIFEALLGPSLHMYNEVNDSPYVLPSADAAKRAEEDDSARALAAASPALPAAARPAPQQQQQPRSPPRAPPAPFIEPPPGAVFWFSYGCSMAYSTLARADVKPLARDAALIPDPLVRVRFKHRGGYATLEKMPTPAAAGASPPASPSGTRSTAPGASAAAAADAADAAAATSSSGGSAPTDRVRFPPFGPHVHGVLYTLAAADLQRLARREAGYVLRDFDVETYDGRRARARAFVSGPLATLPAEVAPAERYMRALRDGAADNYLDPLHQAWLSGVETVSSAGLGPEYYATGSKAIAYGFLGLAGLLIVGFLAQH